MSHFVNQVPSISPGSKSFSAIPRASSQADCETTTPIADLPCEICGAIGAKIHRAREMMFGMKEEFRYGECLACGCLALLNAPSDFSKYYQDGYYSMVQRSTNILGKLRDRVYLSPLSGLVNWHKRSDLDAMKRCGLEKRHRILDVGCGAGRLLRDLRELGYKAEGVDPFITHDIVDRFGVRVFKKSLDEVNGRYDIIVFRHSLEHMPRQLDVLRSARRHIVRGGLCVIAIPLVGWAWRQYGVDWVQLDAPRHLFLHTRKSFESLVAKTELRIEAVVYDSSEFQFWASDLYKEGRALRGCTPPSWFDAIQMRKRANGLNRAQDGDQAQFYLRAI